MECKEFIRLSKKIKFTDKELKLKDAVKILNEYKKMEKAGI